MFNNNFKNLLDDSFFNNINGCSLDNSQRKVILDDSQNLLVIAGAGSGKTLTIIGKIKYLIERKNVNCKDILCISFTNETVNNLKRKIGYDIDCYTFHKLALRILKENNYFYQLAPSDLLAYVIDEYFENLIDDNLKKYVLEYFQYVSNIDISYEDLKSRFYKQFMLYKKMIQSFIDRIKCNNHDYFDLLDYLVKNKRYSKNVQNNHKCFLIVVFDIYRIYLEEINSCYAIDFDSMLALGTELVKDRGMYQNYQYIIIDEFQDTSLVRYQLIKEIQMKTGAKIMCVGDDYQSIYAFSGCNLDLFVNFSKYFPHAKRLFINKTYRNAYEVVNTSCKFVCRNRYQMKKVIKANFMLKKPFKIIYYRDDYQERFYKLLDHIINQGKKEILVLGRNNNDIIPLVSDISGDYFVYRDCEIKYLTVHRAKGLEAEEVILINCNDDYLGFPNKIHDDRVFELISKSREKIPFAEERRLFYVALTRTKNHFYVMCKENKVSSFVLEIIHKFEEIAL